VALGQVSLRVLRFPLPIFIPPIPPRYTIREPADHDNLDSNENRLVADEVSRVCVAGNEIKCLDSEEAHETG
jgi:hypothetical protein